MAIATIEEVKEQSEVQSTKFKTMMTALQNFDYSAGFEMDRRLKTNPDLLKEFVKDPIGVSEREVNLIAPEGFHFHYVNENNEYFPPEGDAISQLQSGQSGKLWGRLEIRMAVGPGCYVACGVCS